MPHRFFPGADAISRWLEESSLVRFAFDLWSAIDSDDLPALRRIAGLPLWQKFPILRGFAINDLSSLRLFQFINMNLLSGTEAFLAPNKQGKPEQRSRPIHLRSAFWLQLSNIVTGARKLKRCEICQEFMDVTGNKTSKRVHQQCSLRERMRRYREKL